MMEPQRGIPTGGCNGRAFDPAQDEGVRETTRTS